MKYLQAKPNVTSIYKQNPYPNHNPHIKLNLKPYYNPNSNPDFLEKLRLEQLSPEQMSCHRYGMISFLWIKMIYLKHAKTNILKRF